MGIGKQEQLDKTELNTVSSEETKSLTRGEVQGEKIEREHQKRAEMRKLKLS